MGQSGTIRNTSYYRTNANVDGTKWDKGGTHVAGNKWALFAGTNGTNGKTCGTNGCDLDNQILGTPSIGNNWDILC